MKIQALMTTKVTTCRPSENLERAAQVMWENDCGCVPVVDSESRVVGIITDRDVCMAAYTQGRSLKEIPVSRIMSKKVFTCRSQDDVSSVEELMRKHQVRRIPVVTEKGLLEGILSLSDLAREAEREEVEKLARKEVGYGDVTRTLAVIVKPRELMVTKAAARA